MKKNSWLSDLQQSPTEPPNHDLPDDQTEMTERLDSAWAAILKIGESFAESEIAQMDEDGILPGLKLSAFVVDKDN